MVCIYLFYPETANVIAFLVCLHAKLLAYGLDLQRTLEEIDYLFTSRSPFTWDAEKEYTRLKALIPQGVPMSGDSAAFDKIMEGKVNAEDVRAEVIY